MTEWKVIYLWWRRLIIKAGREGRYGIARQIIWNRKIEREERTKPVAEEKVNKPGSSVTQVDSTTKPPTGSKNIIEMMVIMADMAINEGNYARAAESYKNILKLEPNKAAQYNLGSLYAQGKGVEQDFMEGAYWFRQARTCRR